MHLWEHAERRGKLICFMCTWDASRENTETAKVFRNVSPWGGKRGFSAGGGGCWQQRWWAQDCPCASSTSATPARCNTAASKHLMSCTARSCTSTLQMVMAKTFISGTGSPDMVVCLGLPPTPLCLFFFFFLTGFDWSQSLG